MNHLDDDEILEVLRKRREQKKIREDAIEFFRGKVERNIPAAVFQFLTAFVVWIYSFGVRSLYSATTIWDDSLLYEVIAPLVPIVLIWQGYRSLVPHPRDRLLYLLAKDALLKEDGLDPGKSESHTEL